MNQKGVIYIILSAILLYLYYRKRDLAIFVGFVVVVVGTLILGKGGEEGFGMGGGGGGGGGIDKDCTEMGFTQPNIDKKVINGSLENAMKNIEDVAETKWPFEKGNFDGNEPDNKKTEFGTKWDVIQKSTFMTDWVAKLSNDMNNKDSKDSKEGKEYIAMMDVFGPASALYKAFIVEKATDATKTAAVNDYKKKLGNLIKSGPKVIEFINKLKKLDEIKEADDEVKDILNYITCLVKQWIAISQAIKAMKRAGGGKKKKKPAVADDE